MVVLSGGALGPAEVSKWVTLLMLALEEGELGHNELRTRIPGASQKMMMSILRALERDGLVSRFVTMSVPVRTDYKLTPLGHSLLAVVHGIKDWAEANMDDVAHARLKHDRQGAGPGRDGAAWTRRGHGSTRQLLLS